MRVVAISFSYEYDADGKLHIIAPNVRSQEFDNTNVDNDLAVRNLLEAVRLHNSITEVLDAKKMPYDPPLTGNDKYVLTRVMHGDRTGDAGKNEIDLRADEQGLSNAIVPCLPTCL